MKKVILIFMLASIAIYGFETNHKFEPKIILNKNIYDGDTFKFDYYKHKVVVRLYGIDTPDRKPYKKVARDFLASKLTNENVYITYIRDGQYNRTDCIVSVNRENINELMIKEGLAIVAEIYCSDDYREKWLKLQEEAKLNKKGFWADESFYPEIERMINKYKIKKSSI